MVQLGEEPALVAQCSSQAEVQHGSLLAACSDLTEQPHLLGYLPLAVNNRARSDDPPLGTESCGSNLEVQVPAF